MMKFAAWLNLFLRKARPHSMPTCTRSSVGRRPAEEVTEEDEELVEKCLEIIRQEKRASTSLLATAAAPRLHPRGAHR